MTYGVGPLSIKCGKECGASLTQWFPLDDDPRTALVNAWNRRAGPPADPATWGPLAQAALESAREGAVREFAEWLHARVGWATSRKGGNVVEDTVAMFLAGPLGITRGV